MIEMKLLHSSQKDTWKYVPVVEDRIKAFCKEYSSDVNPDFLIQFLRMSFISSGPTSLMLAGVDEDGIVVAHCIVLAEKWFGTNVVTMAQLEVDRGTILTEDDWKRGEVAIEAFAQFHGAQQIQVAARNKAAARLFSRRGFGEGRVLMKKPVEGRAKQPSA